MIAVLTYCMLEKMVLAPANLGKESHTMRNSMVPVALTMAQPRQTGPLCEPWWHRHVINICCSSFSIMFSDKIISATKNSKRKGGYTSSGDSAKFGEVLGPEKNTPFIKTKLFTIIFKKPLI